MIKQTIKLRLVSPSPFVFNNANC
ncbi:uncharacterized protein METZ01_LOCUS459166, partial [marine metagenome]